MKKFPIVHDKRYLISSDVGPGWMAPVEAALAHLEAIAVDRVNNGKKPPKVAQIKEKFGELRLYVDVGEDEDWDEVQKIVSEAEEACSGLCEECGKPGTLRAYGWWKTACDDHARKRNDQK